MNATSRALLQTLLTSDTALTEAERAGMDQLLTGNFQTVAAVPSVLSVTQKGAATLLDVSRVTIWRMTKDELLHPVELLPGTWRYPYNELVSLAQRGWRGQHRSA